MARESPSDAMLLERAADFGRRGSAGAARAASGMMCSRARGDDLAARLCRSLSEHKKHRALCRL